jgi:hypothetical protein
VSVASPGNERKAIFKEQQRSDFVWPNGIANLLDLHYSPISRILAIKTEKVEADPIRTSQRDSMLLRALGIWLLLLIVAVLNGGIREAVLTPWLGTQAGHIESTVILCSAIILVAWFSTSWIGPKNASEAFVIGIWWVAPTVAFEFLAGYYVFGNSWERLIADYNVFRGRVWLLVLFTNLFAPLWAFSRSRRTK